MAEETVESLRASLVQANARAEEAERKALMAGQDKVAAQRRADSSHRLMENERAARLKAEKEMNLLIGRDVPRLEERLAAAEAEVKRRDEYPHPCLICFGTRPHSGKPCACGGTNNVYKAIEYAMDAWAKGEVREEGYIREAAALRAGAQRLVEAGDAIVEYVAPHGLGRKLRSDWAAAKAALDAPAGSEAKR